VKTIFKVITNIGNYLVIQNIGIVNNDKNQYFFSHLCTKSLHFQSYYKYWKLSSCLEYWYCKHNKNQYFFLHLNLSWLAVSLVCEKWMCSPTALCFHIGISSLSILVDVHSREYWSMAWKKMQLITITQHANLHANLTIAGYSIQHFRDLLILRYTRKKWIIRNKIACYHFTVSLSILMTCDIYTEYGAKHSSSHALSVYPWNEM